MIKISSSEDMQQFSFLESELGKVESGFVRYAAAMYFFQRGMIGDETLEVYRLCSRLDYEDPVMLLRKRGLACEVQKDGSKA